MLFELIFTDRETGDTVWGVTDVSWIHEIRPDRITITTRKDVQREISFNPNENLEIRRLDR